jgi:hypothetical protein
MAHENFQSNPNFFSFGNGTANRSRDDESKTSDVHAWKFNLIAVSIFRFKIVNNKYEIYYLQVGTTSTVHIHSEVLSIKLYLKYPATTHGEFT